MTAKRLLLIVSDRYFVGVFAIGLILSLAVGWFASDPVSAIIIALLFVLIALVLFAMKTFMSLPEDLELFMLPLLLSRDSDVFTIYRSVLHSLRDISANPDPIYRNLSLKRIAQAGQELSEIASGRIVFIGTETWRIAYEQLLRSPGLHNYRSISHAKTSTYWQDEPGRQSMQVNLELNDAGTLNIERIVILPDHLWPTNEPFPVDPLRGWLLEQHNHGIWICLVRESEIADERDLIMDMGIYGTQAVGYQELDDRARTVCFTLSFDFPEVLAAETRWERLSVYATPFGNLLDQQSPFA